MDPRRSIPAVERLLAGAAFADLVASTPRPLLITLIQSVQDSVRTAPAEYDAEWYARRVTADLDTLKASTLVPVINATGVVLHTNLGRAPLAAAAINAVQRAAGGYATLEYSLETGRRGSRYDHCSRLLRQLTGAEDALVVNNNAAALVLALNTFARRKEVIVSRGELVEIGGSFRVPDIMTRSGARLREVGSTNRTHVEDYADAITARTGALLKVHRSNFSIEGFTTEVGIAALVALAAKRGVPFVYDLGTGLLDDAAELGLANDPTAREAVAAGVGIVTMSGDKLLGGPQAGILLGNAAHVAAMRKNPLCRALRVDKLTIAALEATLCLHLDPALARAEIPTLRMLAMPLDVIRTRAAEFVALLTAAGCDVDIVAGFSAVGGGAAPGDRLATALVRLRPANASAATIERRLRAGSSPVIARIENDAVVIDLRTVAPSEEASLLDALVAAT
ncbi:MAG: L-seryl-tRNA(Sec) selenium transferase [Longimicrobiales bacterium]